ncbi:MAG: CPBP family intramembrane metalloprotease [Bacteroidetes bacterium]|nr:CPBP family intramembrane metalloprotease [Bacteroidota bacterium]
MFEAWHPGYTAPVIAISLLTLGYITYFFLSESNRLRLSFIRKYGEERSKSMWFFFQKCSGFICLGIIPGLVILISHTLRLTDAGINFRNFKESVLWILGLSVLMVIINFFSARKPENLKTYPQIRIREWTTLMLIVSSLGWILYLLGYEFLFRGILLFSCMPLFGMWPSIAINVAFYSLVHIPKGLKETVAAVPMGIILCFLTIKTGSIWVAFFTHVALALSNHFFSIYYHPDMHVKHKVS